MRKEQGRMRWEREDFGPRKKINSTALVSTHRATNNGACALSLVLQTSESNDITYYKMVVSSFYAGRKTCAPSACALVRGNVFGAKSVFYYCCLGKLLCNVLTD